MNLTISFLFRYYEFLFHIQDRDIPPPHKVALLVITYIGCALSLAGEVLTVFVYVMFM